MPTVNRGTRRRRAWLKNPIVFARELQAELGTLQGKRNHTILAWRHGITRARICQYLRLLVLPRDILDFVADPANEDVTGNVTESALQDLLSLRTERQQRFAFSRQVDSLRTCLKTVMP